MTAYMKKNIRTDSLIITGFAVAHALTAMMLGVFNISDELMLTLLTMAMTVILCLRHGLNIEVTAACVIVVNMAGFLLGIYAKRDLRRRPYRCRPAAAAKSAPHFLHSKGASARPTQSPSHSPAGDQARSRVSYACGRVLSGLWAEPRRAYSC